MNAVEPDSDEALERYWLGRTLDKMPPRERRFMRAGLIASYVLGFVLAGTFVGIIVGGAIVAFIRVRQ